MKDPAFLFYAKDFYEATRTMLPEERACYVDLMIYQHQNGGYIPNDLKRVLMYCSGISMDTLTTTLKAKFKLSDKGWYNQKLQQVMEERASFSQKQSVNGKVGQFFKAAAKKLTVRELKKLKATISSLSINNQELYQNWITQYTCPKTMLAALLKHLENVNADEIKNRNITKNENTATTNQSTAAQITLPYPNPEFSALWQAWKDYRHTKHSFSYRSEQSEQAALTQLNNLAEGDQATAANIIRQSMSNGWKGFFELKNNDGKKHPNSKSRAQYSDNFRRKIAEGLQSG
ncbi:hypothetical protein GCM10007424_25200 [Flavobacterium suaedae]|uniref:DUF1376 domain-containing protein n=1 Tax=Flavobacterium suaedae TaxID=1767027 RepID=A0ABQ1K0Q1_9FLAO|nr:DUF1376 domain-containing protein [Flavobacterium suaedae]GGB84141.1 hypothetical protein GCM10007424_25200 [Flavobacterium suaedae]